MNNLFQLLLPLWYRNVFFFFLFPFFKFKIEKNFVIDLLILVNSIYVIKSLLFASILTKILLLLIANIFALYKNCEENIRLT